MTRNPPAGTGGCTVYPFVSSEQLYKQASPIKEHLGSCLLLKASSKQALKYVICLTTSPLSSHASFTERISLTSRSSLSGCFSKRYVSALSAVAVVSVPAIMLCVYRVSKSKMTFRGIVRDPQERVTHKLFALLFISVRVNALGPLALSTRPQMSSLSSGPFSNLLVTLSCELRT